MVFFLGKKREEPQPPVRDYIPVDIVQRMASQGLSEAEIASRLRSQGFMPIQIDRALTMALKHEVAGPPREPSPQMREPYEVRQVQGPEPLELPPTERLPPLPPREEGPTISRNPEPMRSPEFMRPPPERMPPMQGPPRFAPPERIVPPRETRPVMLQAPPAEEFTFERGPEAYEEASDLGEITLEEIIEGTVAEKWIDFEDRLAGFEKRDLQLQGQIEDLRKKIVELEKREKEKEQTLLTRFDDFGESMSGIQGRIGSIEKVFRDFMPELTENIRTMSELVEKAKKK